MSYIHTLIADTPINIISHLHQQLQQAVDFEQTVQTGGMTIRDGYDRELDILRWVGR
jgi:hypothetical protein